ncbi:hypothetical protein CISIN_1g0160991mg, partial [Citrus sinensis]
WFTLKRQHAMIIMADSLYYTKFKHYCKPNMEGRNCYADEHYLPTLFHLELQIGLSHMPIGLKESGIQKRIGHKIFPLSSLRVLQPLMKPSTLLVMNRKK